ncbi:MAG: hypothetical protein JWN13_2083 [Betaproteobacteria bacterium]|nr:hypothetical protein [Betaproteobacteria bacterium]
MSQIDQPEPRWQVILALLAVAGIYMALPRELVVGPTWLLPLMVVVLLIPTVFAHRTGRHSLNHVLGIVIGALITVGLIASVVLLVITIPGRKEPPLALLRAGGSLWLTNVLVFALWYWRLDGGGPRARETKHEFGSRSFVFPQMQIEKMERKTFGVDRWRPGFVDYLFVAFTTSSTFGPTDAPILTHWAKLFTMIQILISLTIMVLLISRAVGVL